MKSWRLADSRHLAYREAGSGRPLVLIHGWAMSSAVFQEALESLGGDLRVLAPDLRGHGRSDRGPSYGFADFAGDLRHWLEGLDLEDAVLVGWSMGGQVLLELFPKVRHRVAGMVLMNSTPRFTAGPGWPHGLPAGQVKTMARNLRRDYRRAMEEFFALQFAEGELSRERHRRIVEFAVRAGRLPEPEVALAALESLREGDQRGCLAGIDCPTLVLHGELDPITPAGAGRHLAEHLPLSRSVFFPGLGHAPFLSRPREVFELWREFQP